MGCQAENPWAQGSEEDRREVTRHVVPFGFGSVGAHPQGVDADHKERYW